MCNILNKIKIGLTSLTKFRSLSGDRQTVPQSLKDKFNFLIAAKMMIFMKWLTFFGLGKYEPHLFYRFCGFCGVSCCFLDDELSECPYSPYKHHDFQRMFELYAKKNKQYNPGMKKEGGSKNSCDIYLDLLNFMKDCDFVGTDVNGLLEELEKAWNNIFGVDENSLTLFEYWDMKDNELCERVTSMPCVYLKAHFDLKYNKMLIYAVYGVKSYSVDNSLENRILETLEKFFPAFIPFCEIGAVTDDF